MLSPLLQRLHRGVIAGEINFTLQFSVSESTSLFNRLSLRRIVALSLGYVALGWVGLALAIPPGYASPMFPAAGLALAMVLVGGYRTLPGVWIGSFCLNLLHSWNGASGGWTIALVPAMIGVGATAQAAIGAWLVQRRQGAQWRSMEREQEAFVFMVWGGLAAGVVSATLSVVSLVAMRVINPGEAGFTWWNWYTGDVLGVMIFAPLTLSFLLPGSLWRQRRRRVVSPMLLTLAIVSTVFYAASRAESEAEARRLAEDGQMLANRISDHLIRHREVLASVRNLVVATPTFTFAEFERFTRYALHENPDIFALSFNDLITAPERAAYEARIAAQLSLQDFHIKERNAQGQLVPAAPAAQHVAVRFIVPMEKNLPAVGYDIFSEPVRRRAILSAMDRGAMSITAPLWLVQDQRRRIGLLELYPVYRSTASDISSRNTQPMGFAVGVLKVDEMITIALNGMVPPGLIMQLRDTDAPVESSLLYRSDVSALDARPLNSADVAWSGRIEVADRFWELALAPDRAYAARRHGWFSWGVGVAGLLFAALLQVLMLGMTGRAAVVQRKNDELRASQQRYLQLFNENPLATWLYDAATERFLLVNDRAVAHYGWPRDVWLTMHRSDIVLGDSRPDDGEQRHRRSDGSLIDVHVNASAATYGDIEARLEVVEDITQKKQTQARIDFLAFHDALTRLPNRVLGIDRLRQAVLVGQRHHLRFALLYLDLDKFKYVNDSHGHTVGDAMLQAVAQRLRDLLRAEDVLCRLSGDEFMILLQDVSEQADAVSVCEKILGHLARPFELEGIRLHTSFSIGIAIYPQDGSDAETLMRNADTAMYEAKLDGRNTYRFFDQQMNLAMLRYVQTRDALRLALERKEFELHFQPQVDLRTGKVSAAEALLRWNRPGHGMVLPAHFVPVAEESGLIVPLGEWVLSEACRQAAMWRDAGWADAVVAVNLSGAQFRHGQLEESVFAALQDSGLEPARLELELTESILMREVDVVMVTLRRLKARGLRLSIDDFGTGYSSLSYLKRFHVDTLKIDQSFIRDIVHDEEDHAIVRAIVQMANSLKLRTIAEGIENDDVVRLLKALGCDDGQGYVFAQPLPSKVFENWLRARGTMG